MNRRIEINRLKTLNRRLFVVDIENAVGYGRISESDVAAVYSQIREGYHIDENDLVILGVSHGLNAFAAAKWPSARIVKREGRDGADLALKRVLAKEDVVQRFTDIVIVSGDGGFSDEVSRLRSQGLCVEVAASARSFSRRLMRAASASRFISTAKENTLCRAA